VRATAGHRRPRGLRQSIARNREHRVDEKIQLDRRGGRARRETPDVRRTNDDSPLTLARGSANVELVHPRHVVLGTKNLERSRSDYFPGKEESIGSVIFIEG
jgi:hypothetical protein